ncbi:MAG TPA: dipeptide/oligopeptide/nickel ABC transporter ATP-binding protein [Clostridiales bacterium]|nr:dipeptide/oligopeptide/nickel ABC transporter ATP-binding protein [Clostridiales bacterium]
MNESMLEINNLRVHYVTDDETVEAVNGVDLILNQGETLGLVGETGAGKTTLAKSIMRILPDPPAKIIEGEIIFQNEDLLKKSNNEMRKIRGNKISMIFQDPMTALNPVITIGDQIAEVIQLHQKLSKSEAALKAKEMLEMVEIPSIRYNEYPHQFSGGMKQRVIIAIALACNPTMLIADEPTTALDVTIQAQVLRLMNKLKREMKTSMLLITHDLGVVAETCDRVAIMYAGEIIESGSAIDIFENKIHPYTRGLFDSIPDINENISRLKPIFGLMPDPSELPLGCKFAERCPDRTTNCHLKVVPMKKVSETHSVRCFTIGQNEEASR